MKLTSIKKIHTERLLRAGYRKAYDELELEFALVSALIRARTKQGLTQAQLAKKIGTKQSAIARFEAGKANPTLAFVQRLSDALNLQLHVRVRH